MNKDFAILYSWFLGDKMRMWLKGNIIHGSWSFNGELITSVVSVKWPEIRPLLLKGIVNR